MPKEFPRHSNTHEFRRLGLCEAFGLNHRRIVSVYGSGHVLYMTGGPRTRRVWAMTRLSRAGRAKRRNTDEATEVFDVFVYAQRNAEFDLAEEVPEALGVNDIDRDTRQSRPHYSRVFCFRNPS